MPAPELEPRAGANAATAPARRRRGKARPAQGAAPKQQPAGDSPALVSAEFFAGIGLVRLALERQGWRVAFANDIDPKKAEMYRRSWPNDDHLFVGDINALEPEQLPTCDLFTASFPCNDLSIAGRREGLDGPESSAIWGLLRLVEGLGERRPRLVLLENVVGFLQSHGGRDFETALLALNDLGYSVDAVIISAAHFTPQSRPRLFVVAERDAGPLSEAVHFAAGRRSFALASDARPAALVRFISGHPEIRWNIRELPALPRVERRLESILEHLPADDPHWWNDARRDYLLNQMSDRHRALAQRMIDGEVDSYATVFRRVRRGVSMAELRVDGLAGCLRTPRGGSGRQILFRAGRGSYGVRLLTARECARLQGVPDSYPIDVPLNQALFGFGDAVCVPAVEWLLEHYLSPVARAARGQHLPG